MDRPDMHNGGRHHKEDQRQVKDVPQRKESLIKGKFCSLQHRAEVECYDFTDAGQPLASLPSRPISRSAFQSNETPRLAEQPRA